MTTQNENSITIKINPKIYPLNTIYSSSYVFLDKCYIILDGNPETGISVTLTPKDNNISPDILAKEFHNELLNYSFYEEQSRKNADLKNTLLQAALFANTQTETPCEQDDFDWSELEDIKNEEIQDTESIATPWEEKYPQPEGEDTK